jgi:hypothetical protein
MNAFRNLEEELYTLFPLYQKLGSHFFEDVHDKTPFQAFCRNLAVVISKKAIECTGSSTEPSPFSLQYFICTMAESGSLHCPVCYVENGDEQPKLPMPTGYTNPLAILQSITNRLRICFRHRRSTNVADAREPYYVTYKAAQTDTHNLLMDTGLLEYLPDMSKHNPCSVPDDCRIFPHSSDRSVILGTLDCLGRTYLHRYLDCKPLRSGTSSGKETTSSLGFYLSIAKFSQADINQSDIFGRTALHVACQKNQEYMAKTLLESGANPTAATVCGLQPLHFAAANGSKPICRLLIAFKAEVNALDKLLQTPMNYAKANNCKESIEFLSTL